MSIKKFLLWRCGFSWWIDSWWYMCVTAGIFCAIVSHPADTIVSKLNQDKGSNFVQIAKKLGLMGKSAYFSFHSTVSCLLALDIKWDQSIMPITFDNTHSLDPPLGHVGICRCLVVSAVASNLSVVLSEVLESLVCDSNIPGQVDSSYHPSVTCCRPHLAACWCYGGGFTACPDKT